MKMDEIKMKKGKTKEFAPIDEIKVPRSKLGKGGESERTLSRMMQRYVLRRKKMHDSMKQK